MHPVPVPFELLLPGFIFAAGGFYFVVRGALKQFAVDINGIGRKMADLKETQARAEFRNAVMLLAFCPENERKKIAEYLLEGK
jgi:hypothetical protein